MISDYYKKNKNFKLSSISDLGFGYDGYEFSGWKTDLCGDNILTDMNDVVFNAKDVYLSAQWKKLENQLYFEAGEPNSTIKLTDVAGTYKTSTNGIDWTDYELGTLCTLTNIGDKIYFSARDKNATCWNGEYFGKFIMTGKIGAHGNIQYLLDSTGEQLSVPEHCYSQMFQNCTSLSTAPELPATEIAEGCYSQMFQNCTSLSTAPELPATELADYCYNGMFYNCSSLSIAENDSSYGYLMLSAPETTAQSWGTNMLDFTAGTFAKNPKSLSCYYCHVN